MSMKSALLAIACAVAGLSAGACETTRTVRVDGLVLDLSGAPVAGAEIRASRQTARGQAASGADGRFSLVVERDRSGVVLPASGVYVDPVAVSAATPDAVAFSAAPALSVSRAAEGPAVLILLPAAAVPGQAGCLSQSPSEAYALALAERLNAQRPWLSDLRDGGATQGLHQKLRADIAAAARRCGLPEARRRSADEAVDAALDPFQDG